MTDSIDQSFLSQTTASFSPDSMAADSASSVSTASRNLLDDEEEDVRYRLYDDDEEDELQNDDEPLDNGSLMRKEEDQGVSEKEHETKTEECGTEIPQEPSGMISFTRWFGRTVNYFEESPTVRRVLRFGWIPLVIGMGIATVEPGITLLDVLAPINFRDRTTP